MSISSGIANDKLVDLRHKKKLAIQALDFDGAEEYDRQIKEHNEKLTADRIGRIFQEILKDLQDHIAKYDGIRADIADFLATQTALLNATYQDLFDKAQIQHEKELRNIDKSHGIALIREAEREVPAQIELLEKAKGAAIVGQFSEARRLQEEARRTGESELEARKERIDQEFSESRSILAARQQEAIAKIGQKYEDEMNDLNAEVRARRVETQQRFDAGVDLIRERGAIRCNALVAGEELKGDALFSLNQKISETLRYAQSGSSSSAPVKSEPQQREPSRATAATSSVKRAGKPARVGGASPALGRKVSASGSSTANSGRSSRSSRSRLSADTA